MLHPGDLVSVPVRKDGKPHVHTVVVERVWECRDDALYCLRGADGPTIWIRESRLAQLRARLASGVA